MRTGKLLSEKQRLLRTEEGFQKVSSGLSFLSLILVFSLFYRRFISGNLWEGSLQGDIAWTLLIAAVVANAVLCFMIRASRRAWMAEEKEILEDSLTGVLNPAGFEKALEAELRRAARYRYPVAICHINIDNFNSYEDCAEMLRQFASFLYGNIRFADSLARFDKDDFFVLLPHTDIARAEKFLSRVLIQSQERLDYGFSAGVTAYQTGETRARLMTRATQALAQAKQGGRKAFRFVASDQAVLSF
jgi:diguanylate cyclase (GGDEF)-like protein